MYKVQDNYFVLVEVEPEENGGPHRLFWEKSESLQNIFRVLEDPSGYLTGMGPRLEPLLKR